MINESKGLPLVTLYLGYGGLLPFLGLTIASYLGYDSQSLLGISVESWLAIYAAVILSFLGAIHWGVVVALSDKLHAKEINSLLIYSVIPALLAWLYFLFSLKLTLYFLAFTVLLSYFLDYLMLFKILKLHVNPQLSNEFARLRLHLSLTVSILLFLTAVNLA